MFALAIARRMCGKSMAQRVPVSWVHGVRILHTCGLALRGGTKYTYTYLIEGSLEAKLPTIWTDEKQSREEAERRDRSEEKRSEERRCRCAKR